MAARRAPLSQSLCQEAITTNSPVSVEDVRADPRLRRRRLLGSADNRRHA